MPATTLPFFRSSAKRRAKIPATCCRTSREERSAIRVAWRVIEKPRSQIPAHATPQPAYNSDMSERKTTAVWPWVVAVFIGLPVLYVLSYGPWALLVMRDKLPQSTLTATIYFYGPLRWAER